MLGPVIGAILALVGTYGAIILLGVFVLEGALVGKVIPTRTLFVGVRRFDVDPTELSVVPVGPDGLDDAARWFDRWGLPAVAVTNALPGTRGWLAVPTANSSSVSASRFVAASLVGSTVYAGALLGVALAIALGFGTALQFAVDGTVVPV